MAKTQEELEQEAAQAAVKANEEFASQQRSEAEGARLSAADTAESEEEYAERIRLASSSGIFGDTDTTAGAGAVNTDVPSANNEQATVAVAEADAAAAAGDEDAAAASDDEARRQVDVDGGTAASAEDVDAAASDDSSSEGTSDEDKKKSSRRRSS
jgi:hypothetical protein